MCEAERLAEYEALRPEQRASIEQRLAEGERCFGAWLDGELVSARWIAVGEPRVDYLGMLLPLGPNEVYMYDSYTAPLRRGRGIASAGLAVLYPILATEGRSRVVCACLPENRSGLRSIAKAGFRPAGKMGYVGLGPWRHTFVRRRQAAGHSSRSTA